MNGLDAGRPLTAARANAAWWVVRAVLWSALMNVLAASVSSSRPELSSPSIAPRRTGTYRSVMGYRENRAPK